MIDSDPRHAAYCRNLAAALQNGDWTSKGHLKQARLAVGPKHRWLKPLLVRVLVAFPERPSDRKLSAFLIADEEFLAVWQKRFQRRLGPLEIEDRFAFPCRMHPPTVPLIRDVPQLATPRQLADWFGIPARRLDWYADLKGLNDRAEENLQQYRRHWRLKRSGRQYRLLEEPKPVLKSIQRQILADILDWVPPHAAAHGFTRGRSIATNAVEHCGRAIVIRYDLQDFFPSIPAPRVAAVFESLGYPRGVAVILAGLCTTRLPPRVWNSRPGLFDENDHAQWLRLAVPHLPQGAPTSPALANLCAYRLDCRLSALARNLDATYTRYADDLTFSGNAELAPARLQRCVMEICGEEGFVVNPRKTRIQRQSTRQSVAGVVVNVRPNVPRTEYDLLKAILTNCVRHGPAEQNRHAHADFRMHLSGWLAFVSMVNPARGRRLWRLFDRIQWM